jgi:hypothetical protein
MPELQVCSGKVGRNKSEQTAGIGVGKYIKRFAQKISDKIKKRGRRTWAL